ncbi:MAG: Gfo/Idh/MocA family oxidoreductase, partial [bacterium]|nr:Gfo/Idh/MocA family oxidoreductase [bacterium]
IGAGMQGQVLLSSCLKAIGALRFRAVCDIWPYNRNTAANLINAYNRREAGVAEFSDYREMLSANDKLDLDAVIIATPDWMHAECAIACMKAGLHVYCEKEMSNSLELAGQMVAVSRDTKKLLQIGRQRRSNPRYIRAIDDIVLAHKALGRVGQAWAQWNRRACKDIGWPAKHALSARELARYGYDTMSHLCNWRWFKRYGGGPIVDFGAHQIDIFNWVFGSTPKSVIASGGTDYYKHHQWYDNVMCIFEYETADGVARAGYQVQTTTGHGGFHEVFMGEYGTLVISEVPRFGNRLVKDPNHINYNYLFKAGLLKEKSPVTVAEMHTINLDARCCPTCAPQKWPLRTELNAPPHQPHLQNFFDALRGKAKLNCPGQLAYKTAQAVLAVNHAVKTQKKIKFTKKGFEVEA